MKTKLIAILMIALSMGCVRNTEPGPCLNDGEITLYATAGGAGTKTVLQQDGTVFWNQEDCINVFYGGKSGKFTSTNNEKSASAAFVGTLEPFVLDGTTEFVAAYPYSEETTFSGNKLDIKLPSEQLAQEGTFADDLYICVAKSKDYNLFFYNVCGGVKFSLGRDDIKKVVFRGNDGETLAGRLSVEFDSDGKPVVSGISEGKSSVTIVPPDGGTFKKWSFYYLVLVPQSLQKGYTIELYTDELAETINSDSAVTVRRSAWGVLNGMGAVPEAIDMGLSVKWASFNLGSTRPEEYGDYFAWGAIEPLYDSLNPLLWKDGVGLGYSWESCSYTGLFFDANIHDYLIKISKYNTDSSYGPVDNKITLELEDDAAHVNLGGSWRMPTQEECNELIDNCTTVWTSQNGVYGRKFTSKINGNSIFLPAAGYWEYTGLFYVGTRGDYWSSSLHTDSPEWAYPIYFGEDDIYGNFFRRHQGQSIRPVTDKGVRVSVTGITLNMSSLTLSVDEMVDISASVTPSNATQKDVIWSSSDTSVATVSLEGVVTAVAPGIATIIATTHDGGFTATCKVTVSAKAEWVDLGLPSGIKWASCNLGATKPEEYGDYFAWGEIEPYYETGYAQAESPVWKPGKENGYEKLSSRWYTEGVGMTGYSLEKGKVVLDPEDDAAHVMLGEDWRIPSWAEVEELGQLCSREQVEQNGVKGVRVTGPNGNSIFFPLTGKRAGVDLLYSGETSSYWANSLLYGEYAHLFNLLNPWTVGWNWYYGASIRPVFGSPLVPVESVGLGDTEIKMSIGETFELKVSIVPENATFKKVEWDIDGQVVSIKEEEDGYCITGKTLGTGTIYFYSCDGGKVAKCKVTVTAKAEWVDLGLPSGVKWATCNLGATKPEEYGDYFAWGETSPYYESGYAQSDSPVWRRIPWSGQSYYNTGGYGADSYMYYNSSEGDRYADKTFLDLEDDAAHVMFGDEWRIPSWAEMSELRNKCTWELTMVNGSIGCKVTGPNGNSIFLPAAGDRSGMDKYYSGNDGLYWTSTRYPTSERRAVGLDFDIDGVNKVTGYYRYYGFTIRPVYGYPPVPVESVSFDKTWLKIAVGEKAILEDRIVPENATFKSITVLTSNSKVATLAYDENGAIVVTGVSEGSAVITIFTTDGRAKATCTVVVSNSVVEPEAVDLGLPSGVKWASFNVGATKPEEYGDYFAWGATEPYYESQDPIIWKEGKGAGYTWSNCPYCTSGDSEENIKFSKYNTDDNKTTLEMKDDAARANWGGSWRMPTDSEFKELRLTRNNNADYKWEWVAINDIEGWKITYLVNGNSIFLPAAGNRSGTNLRDTGIYGSYWSSSLNTGGSVYANCLYFRWGVAGDGSGYRNIGLPVRPVMK